MSHICFVDGADFTLLAMKRAVQLGHRVTFIRSSAFSWYQKNAASLAILGCLNRIMAVGSAGNVEELTATIMELQSEEPIDAIINTMDPTIEATAIVAARLGLPFTSPQGVANARNKGRARELIAAAGLPSTDFAVVRKIEDVPLALERLRYPVVLKPVSGYDSLLVVRADTLEQALHAAREILRGERYVDEEFAAQLERGVLIERYLEGELISAEIGMVNGQSLPLLVSGRSVLEVNECLGIGAIVPGDLDGARCRSAFDYAEKVCRTLGLDFGLFHIELVMTESGPILVEANPRIMGGAMTAAYEFATGHDFNDYLIDIHLRQPVRALAPAGGRHALIQKIMPLEDGRIRDEIDLGWIKAEQDLMFLNQKIVGGRDVTAMEALGRFIIRAENVKGGTADSERLLDRLASSLGVRLLLPRRQ